MMKVKDNADGLSREGCGRVAIMQACGGLPNCYTLECNYATGRRINYISARQVKGTREQLPEDNFINDAKHKFYTNGDKAGRAPVYTIEVFEDVGKAFLISLLDYNKCNTISRVPSSWYKSLDGVKNDLISKCSIFMPKPTVPEAKPRPKMARVSSAKQQQQKPITAPCVAKEPQASTCSSTTANTQTALQKKRASQYNPVPPTAIQAPQKAKINL